MLISAQSKLALLRAAVATPPPKFQSQVRAGAVESSSPPGAQAGGTVLALSLLQLRPLTAQERSPSPPAAAAGGEKRRAAPPPLWGGAGVWMARREDGGVTPNGIAKASGGPAASRGAAKVVTPLGPAAPCRPVLSPPPGLDLSLRGSSTGSAGTGLPLPCLGPSRQRRGALGGSGAAEGALGWRPRPLPAAAPSGNKMAPRRVPPGRCGKGSGTLRGSPGPAPFPRGRVAAWAAAEVGAYVS